MTRLVARSILVVVLFAGCSAEVARGQEWVPLAVAEDPLVRLPGTQPGQVVLEGPGRCLNCHADFDPVTEPGFGWQGSMMAQAARDYLFWPSVAVAAQDSIWAVGRPNGTDLCLRCHLPKGWLEGRSEPTNGSAFSGDDFDGVQCDFCHRLYDPFFATTYDGSREGDDWLGYWDETGASGTPSQPAADETYAEDLEQSGLIDLFNGNLFFVDGLPPAPDYVENGSGQYFVSTGSEKRGPFADAAASHQMLYSRYHRSKYFCSTCHDVSNSVLANLGFIDTAPGDGVTVLPSEEQAAHSYFHLERTFSEFMLSDYGLQGGAPGIGPYAPEVFDTSTTNNFISRCQDCHQRDAVGKACDKNQAVLRPDESIEHPASGVPTHDFTGGNVLVPWVLASAVPGSPNYDPTNEALLGQGAAILTLDLTQGLGLDPEALLSASERAERALGEAAALENLSYDQETGDLSIRIRNQTGHKLASGYAEGRRMFVNIRAYDDGALIWEVNPYDSDVGTLKGLPDSDGSPPLDPGEEYVDELVYEAHFSSTLTGEAKTLHLVLADGRFKDNRIPPRGFRTAEMADRLVQPVWEGADAPDYFSPEEYLGGYDDVDLTIVPDADEVEINLYYQTTSREYVEFLRDEINGVGDTLPPEAYLIQTDPFFDSLRAWGGTIWDLWEHNKNVPGAAPFLMTQASIEFESDLSLVAAGSCPGPVTLDLAGAQAGSPVALLWSTNPGTVVVPSGGCAGTELGLEAPRLLTTLMADVDGNASLSVNAPGAACGLYLQALDLGSCDSSNVTTLP